MKSKNYLNFKSVSGKGYKKKRKLRGKIMHNKLINEKENDININISFDIKDRQKALQKKCAKKKSQNRKSSKQSQSRTSKSGSCNRIKRKSNDCVKRSNSKKYLTKTRKIQTKENRFNMMEKTDKYVENGMTTNLTRPNTSNTLSNANTMISEVKDYNKSDVEAIKCTPEENISYSNSRKATKQINHLSDSSQILEDNKCDENKESHCEVDSENSTNENIENANGQKENNHGRKCCNFQNINPDGKSPCKVSINSSPFMDEDCSEMIECWRNSNRRNESPFRESLACRECSEMDEINIKIGFYDTDNYLTLNPKTNLNESPFVDKKCKLMKTNTCQNTYKPKKKTITSNNIVENESAFAEDICRNKCNKNNNDEKQEQN